MNLATFSFGDMNGFKIVVSVCLSVCLSGEYQPLIMHTFVVTNVFPVKEELLSHGRVVSFFAVVFCSVFCAVCSSGNCR